MQLGKIIRTLRQKKSLTQTELAEKSNLNRAQLSSIENGKAPPFRDFTKYSLLADVLGRDAEELWRIGQRDRREWKARGYKRKAEILGLYLVEKPSCPTPILSRLPLEMAKGIKHLAAERNMGIVELVREILEEYLRKNVQGR